MEGEVEMSEVGMSLLTSERTTEPTVVPPVVADNYIVLCEREIADLKAERRAQDQRIRELQRDIDSIGEALIREAEEREWCDEFDTFVEGMNQTLTYSLPERQWTETTVLRVMVEVQVTYDKNKTKWSDTDYLKTATREVVEELLNEDDSVTEFDYVRVTNRY